MDKANHLEDVKQLIQQEDFDFLITRLMKEKKWSYSEAQEACQYYKNFLILNYAYGNNCKIPPSMDIDEVWHMHILFTQKYKEFCQKYFGRFLHHNLEDENSILDFEELFESTTQKLHKIEFGDFIYSVKQQFFLTSYIRQLLEVLNITFAKIKNHTKDVLNYRKI